MRFRFPRSCKAVTIATVIYRKVRTLTHAETEGLGFEQHDLYVSVCNLCVASALTGRWNLVCVHAKTHGIALSPSMPLVCLRLAGLLPMLSRPSSPTGVARLKYSMNSGRWNT